MANVNVSSATLKKAYWCHKRWNRYPTDLYIEYCRDYKPFYISSDSLYHQNGILLRLKMCGSIFLVTLCMSSHPQVRGSNCVTTYSHATVWYVMAMAWTCKPVKKIKNIPETKQDHINDCFAMWFMFVCDWMSMILSPSIRRD